MSDSKDALSDAIKKVSVHADDRVVRYVNEQHTMSPKQFLSTTRKYWIIGTLLNFAGFSFIATAVYNTMSENATSTLNLVRIDGVKIQEAFDVRRSVMMKNALSRAKLKQNNDSK